MRKKTIGRVSGFVGAVGVTTALVAMTAGSTGAYFSDSRSGTISGTIGSIQVKTSGGSGTDGLDFSFNNMLPGTPSVANASYTNSGHNQQDVWLVFPNTDALHGLNTLGGFGEVHVVSNGTEVFASNNLNDDTVKCPPGASDATHGPCNALPREIKLASSVDAGAGGTFSFSFMYSKLLKGASAENQPMTFATGVTGLPYQIVATQVGVSPDDSLNTTNQPAPNNVGAGH